MGGVVLIKMFDNSVIIGLWGGKFRKTKSDTEKESKAIFKIKHCKFEALAVLTYITYSSQLIISD